LPTHVKSPSPDQGNETAEPYVTDKKSGAGGWGKSVALVLVVATAVSAWVFYQQRVERQRLLQEQEQLERVLEEKRAAEREAERKRTAEIFKNETETRQREEEERLRLAREQREEEMKNEKYVAGKPYVPPVKTSAELRDDYLRLQKEVKLKNPADSEERQRRMQSESETAAARAEVERQKRYLEQQQREEDEAAARRARSLKTPDAARSR